jgi:phage tail sheath gpL-like
VPVSFNAIPSNLRVPLFYAEINSGLSPYQAPSRTLLIGQKTSGGSAIANVPVLLGGDPTGLFGSGAMLTEMAFWARQNHPFGEIWALPLADPAGVAQTHTVTIGVGILGSQGTLVLYIGGEKIQIAVKTTDANTDVATNLSAAINLGYNKFGFAMAFPVIASVASNVVTLTSRHVGALGGKQSILKDLVGDEGPLATYITIAAGTAGTGVPSLSAALASLGDDTFDFICAPYADTTSLDTVKTFLDGVSGRWSPIQQLYGHYFTAMFDTYSNLASFGTGRNDPNVSIMGVVDSPSSPWRWAASLGARIAADKNLGGEVDQAYRISRPVQTLELVGIRPPQSQSQLVHHHSAQRAVPGWHRRLHGRHRRHRADRPLRHDLPAQLGRRERHYLARRRNTAADGLFRSLRAQPALAAISALCVGRRQPAGHAVDRHAEDPQSGDHPLLHRHGERRSGRER